ncbi:MAG: TRAP transporter substrate-binding protein [Chromatiales bacterium]|jgi:TRAP-type mannitol/chloroaromatic compound transport system substrate-binding protein
MQRRRFLKGVGAGAVLAGAAACGSERQGGTDSGTQQRFSWKMVTTWPPGLPGLGTGAQDLADAIRRNSGGRIQIQFYAAGELVPPLEVFDAVSTGTAEMGHGAAYYWKGKSEAAQFFATVPFGMNAVEMNAWLYYGGGWELWREIYAPFGVVPFPAGNSGTQMGGWFNKEINSLDDLVGLKMRIPGLGGEVLKRVGVTPVNVPASELFTALETGTIDATEWVGPYNDLALGLFRAASYYYYPGWHEPGPTLECIVNRAAWESLPDDLQGIVESACAQVNVRMQSEFMARNQDSLAVLMNEHGITPRPFPDEVLRELRRVTDVVLDERSAADADFKRVRDAYKAYQAKMATWQNMAEMAYHRSLSL